MPEYLHRGSRERVVEHSLEALRKSDHTSGVSFQCDENGVILNPLSLTEAAINNLVDAMFSKNYGPLKVSSFFRTIRHPSIIICNYCRSEVILFDAMTNQCEVCKQFYNGSGQQLAHPSQWGYDTGENFNENGEYVGGGEEL